MHWGCALICPHFGAVVYCITGAQKCVFFPCAKSTFLRYVVGLSSAVIGSGVHVAMVCSDWLWCACDCGGSGGQCSRNL